ncbi:MAG: hypothetical protein M8467_17025 [Anaerolineae bacterium]|nr:hypothetical protein [Anaerolineae bacterium]
MSAQDLAERICETIHSLPEDQLGEVLRFVQDLKSIQGSRISEDAIAPLYSIHTSAVRTGISDLAHQHDHYLYGVEKRDA